MVDFSKLIEQAATEGPDMNEAKAGGGPREVPAAGMVRLRFISYIEIGVHEDEDQKGNKRDKEFVKLQFEHSGPKHPPRVSEDGNTKYPQITTITLPLSLNEKSHFYKLFKRMNHTGEYRHMSQMLGQDFLGTIVHRDNGKEGDAKRIYANLRDDGGYTIRPPFNEDPETGESKRITADPAITPLKCFLWNYGDQPAEPGGPTLWDMLFIDGKYDDKTDDSGKIIQEGKSKNYWQNLIRSAKNFADSPVGQMLFAGGAPDLPGAEQPERKPEDVQAGVEAKAAANSNNTDPLENVA